MRYEAKKAEQAKCSSIMKDVVIATPFSELVVLLTKIAFVMVPVVIGANIFLLTRIFGMLIR